MSVKLSVEISNNHRFNSLTYMQNLPLLHHERDCRHITLPALPIIVNLKLNF